MAYRPAASIHVIADLQRSQHRAFDRYMLAMEADTVENTRVSGIIDPVRTQRNLLEEELAEYRNVITNRQPALQELYIRYDQALTDAQRSPRDPEVIGTLSSAAGQLYEEEKELRRVRDALPEMENIHAHLTAELRRLTDEYAPATLQRNAELRQLYRPVEESRNESANLRQAARDLWGSWTADERIRHFEAADFDFGLFLNNRLSEDDYIFQLQQAYREARPGYAVPIVVILDTMAALVRDGQYHQPAETPLWAGMTLPRGYIKVESLENDPEFRMSPEYQVIPE